MHRIGLTCLALTVTVLTILVSKNGFADFKRQTPQIDLNSQPELEALEIDPGQVIYPEPGPDPIDSFQWFDPTDFGSYDEKAAIPPQPDPESYKDEAFAPDYLISFEAKGLNLFWDIGMMSALEEQVKGFSQSRFVFTGSSSGSILTSYFSCYGATKESIDSAYWRMMAFDTNAVNEEPSKNRELIRSLLQRRRIYPREADYSLENEFKRVEYDHSVMMPTLLAYLKPRDKAECRPNFPTIIVAANGNTLRNFHEEYIPRLIRARQRRLGKRVRITWLNKQVDYSNLSVIHNFQNIGKACTYFADPIMHAELQQIPEHERLCDIRLMSTADDMIFAVLASISEPTYYRPLFERDYSKLTGLREGETKRYYRGGMAMMNVVQDAKRLAPDMITIGAGRPPFADFLDGFVSKRYAVSMNRSFFLSKYWLDIDVVPKESLGQQLLKQEFGKGREAREKIANFGFQQTTSCLQTGDCRPRGSVCTPTFRNNVCPSGVKDCEVKEITAKQRGVSAIRKKYGTVKTNRENIIDL